MKYKNIELAKVVIILTVIFTTSLCLAQLNEQETKEYETLMKKLNNGEKLNEIEWERLGVLGNELSYSLSPLSKEEVEEKKELEERMFSNQLTAQDRQRLEELVKKETELAMQQQMDESERSYRDMVGDEYDKEVVEANIREMRERNKDFDTMKENLDAKLGELRKNKEMQGGRAKEQEILSKYNPVYGHMREINKEKIAANSLKQIALSLELYKLDNDQYPQTLDPINDFEDEHMRPKYADGYSYVYKLNQEGFIVEAFPVNDPDNTDKKLFINEAKVVHRGSIE